MSDHLAINDVSDPNAPSTALEPNYETLSPDLFEEIATMVRLLEIAGVASPVPDELTQHLKKLAEREYEPLYVEKELRLAACVNRLRAFLADNDLLRCYEQVEKPVLRAVATMRSRPIQIDVDVLARLVDRKKDHQARSLIDNSSGGITRMRPTIDPLGAVTGQMTMSQPALIRWRGPLRTAIVPYAGNVFIQATYQQLLLRIAVTLAGDEALLAAFEQGRDFHAWTASQLAGKPVEDLTPNEQRLGFKVITAALLFGRSVYEEIDAGEWEGRCSRAGTKRVYCRLMPILAWADETVLAAYDDGFFRAASGRRRKWPTGSDADLGFRKQAQSTMLRGTAADIIKTNLIELDRELPEGAYLVLSDAKKVLVEAPEELEAEVIDVMREVMVKNPFELPIPLAVAIGSGENWGQC